MKFKKLIKYFFLCTSAYFTVLSGTLLLLLTLLTNEGTNVGVEPSRFLLLLAFCCAMSLGSTVRRAAGVPRTVGWACNAILYVGGCFGFLAAAQFKLGAAAIVTAIFACIYAPIAIFIAFREKKKRGGSMLNAQAKSASNSPKASSKKNNTSSNTSKASDKKDNSTYQNLFS